MTLVKRAQAKAPDISRTKNRPRPTSANITPAAGAHAAHHLTNDDATPGAGVLTSLSGASRRYVDGGAG